MRPVFASSSTGTVTVVTNANGWNFFYDIQDTTGRFNYQSQDYCSIPNLAFNVWSHIVGTYSLSPNFSCYVNATFVSSYTGSIISGKSPAALLIGGNFYGNVVDLRAWQGITLSLYAISKNYTSIFVSPWPTSLSKYYKLSDGSTSIKESIAGSTQNLPTSMKTPWLTETTGSLVLCSPGYYNSAGNCNVCPSTCSFCKGTQTSACYNTARNFVNTTLLASSDIIKFVFPASTSTIEFWLYPSSWGTNIQLLTIQNLLNVQQRAADSIISLYDGSGTEKYNFSAPIQNWVHVAWVWSSKTATIYVNGTSSPSFTWSNTTAGTVVYINNSTSSKFQGLVADLRLWSSARSITQIQSNLYTSFTTTTTQTGLLKACPLNDKSTTLKCSDGSSATFSSLTTAWVTQDCTSQDCLFECPFQNYYNSSLGECYACDSSCQACNGPTSTNCTVCLPSDFQIPGVSSCYKSACPTGYVAQGQVCQTSCNDGYYSNSGTCTLCNSNCTACSSSTYCTSCATGYSIFVGTSTSSCIANCNSGMYVNSALACASCSTSCAECFGTSTNCTSCSSTQFLYNNACYSSCPAYSYTSGTNCFSCDVSCNTCTGSTNLNCTTCKTGYSYTDSQGRCYQTCPAKFNVTSMMCLDSCNSNEYALSTGQCAFCDSSCVSCNGGTSSNCTACPNVLYNGTCSAYCPSHAYLNLTTCYECDYTCGTCNSESTNCTSCISPYPYQGNNSCYSVCPSGTFTLSANSSCVVACPSGYLAQGSNCIVCDSNCLACSGAVTTCTQCPSNEYLYNSTCVGVCPYGYYGLGVNCVACGPNCNSCSDYNFCTACKNQALYVDPYTGTCNTTCNTTTYVFNQSCVATCATGYYPSQSPNQCLPCPAGCTSCTSSSQCLQCNSTYFKQDSTCVASCPSIGYYTNYTGGYCNPCNEACTACNGNSIANCTVCKGSNVVLVDNFGVGSCVATCPAGYFQSATMCNNCPSTCASCTNSTTCHSCISGYFLLGSYSCATSCNSGDLVNPSSNTCMSYQGLTPSGTVNLQLFSMIQITYPITVTPGSGTLTIFSVNNGTYTQVQSVYIMGSTTISLGNSLAISISASLLSYSTNYTIELLAGVVASSQGASSLIPRGTWNFNTASFQYGQLVVTINGGVKGVEVQNGGSQFLDASASYDTSSGYRKLSLTGTWNCSDYTASYAQYTTSSSRGYSTSWADYIQTVALNDPNQGLCSFWNYTHLLHTPNVTVGPLTQTSQVIRISYNLTDGISRWNSSAVFIIVIPDSIPLVTLTSVPLYKVNTDKILQLIASDPITDTAASYIWSCYTTGSTPGYLTPLNSWSLSIGAYTMSVNTVYTFSLTYRSITVSSVVVSITTNSPPTGGALSISSNTGTSIQSSFTAQMLGWTDVDLPLSYSFFLMQGGTSIGYQISVMQSNPVLVTFYPGGNLTLVGYCYDSLGSRANTTVALQIADLCDIGKLNSLFDNLPNVVTEDNVETTLPKLFAFSEEFGCVGSETSTILGFKTAIMNKLISAKDIADTLYTRDSDINSLYLYFAVLGNVNSLIQDPASLALLNSSLILVNSIDYSRLSLKQQIYPISNSTISAESPQYVFRMDELHNFTAAMGSIINTVSVFSGATSLSAGISSLTNSMNLVLGLGASLSEQPRTVSLASATMVTSTSLLTNLVNSNTVISTGVQVTFPDSFPSSLNATQASTFVAFVNSNPYNDSSVTLNQYLLVEMKDVDTQENLVVQGLSSPFLLSFNISRSDLSLIHNQVSASQGMTSSMLPECAFWNSNTSAWSGVGCSLYNIGDIFSYLDFAEIPDYVPLVCSCNHLSQFTVRFSAGQQFLGSTYMIAASDVAEFSSGRWETSVVLYLMVAGVVTLVVTMSLAYYWDNYNPGLGLPSVETEKTFSYWDSNKVVAVLSQLEKEFIRQLTDSGKSEKKDTTAAISKILNSGLVNKLMLENTKDLKENYEDNQRAGRAHPVEIVMKTDSDDESLNGRTKRYLKKGVDDPRHVPSLVSEPKPRGNSSRKDLENTMAQLKLHLNHLETNTHVKTPIDLFLERYDESEKLPPALKAKLKLDNRDLTKSDLKTLGINPSEFAAMRTSKNGKLVPDSTLLTGGKYCK